MLLILGFQYRVLCCNGLTLFLSQAAFAKCHMLQLVHSCSPQAAFVKCHMLQLVHSCSLTWELQYMLISRCIPILQKNKLWSSQIRLLGCLQTYQLWSESYTVRLSVKKCNINLSNVLLLACDQSLAYNDFEIGLPLALSCRELSDFWRHSVRFGRETSCSYI